MSTQAANMWRGLFVSNIVANAIIYGSLAVGTVMVITSRHGTLALTIINILISVIMLIFGVGYLVLGSWILKRMGSAKSFKQLRKITVLTLGMSVISVTSICVIISILVVNSTIDMTWQAYIGTSFIIRIIEGVLSCLMLAVYGVPSKKEVDGATAQDMQKKSSLKRKLSRSLSLDGVKSRRRRHKNKKSRSKSAGANTTPSSAQQNEEDNMEELQAAESTTAAPAVTTTVVQDGATIVPQPVTGSDTAPPVVVEHLPEDNGSHMSDTMSNEEEDAHLEEDNAPEEAVGGVPLSPNVSQEIYQQYQQALERVSSTRTMESEHTQVDLGELSPVTSPQLPRTLPNAAAKKNTEPETNPDTEGTSSDEQTH